MITKRYAVLLAVAIGTFLVLAGVIFAVLVHNNRIHGFHYPRQYEQWVGQYAEENEVPEPLMFAVIYTESRFLPDAESGMGARGLMQLTEDTFNWVKGRLSDPDDVTFDAMYDPETNIRYGAYLLGYLKRQFENEQCMLSAYHAGISRVMDWLGNEEYSSDGVHLDTIPFTDTAHYVNKVGKALAAYERMP